MPHQTRVAILGATGIGKHHAKWYALEGCEVAAFLGSSERTVERTAAAMRDLFGFVGQGYTNADELLAKESLDAVSVCTPHHLHKAHTIKALRAGLHVLCEKPLVWDGDKSSAQMLADAEEMLAFTSFPEEHGRQISQKNPRERVHREIRPRTGVAGIFPRSPRP